MAVSSTGIRYTDLGPADADDSNTFLLIHGLGGSLEQWGAVQDRLASRSRVIAIDVPGFGGSEHNGSFNLEKSIGQLADFVLHMNLRRSVLVSHSIGCVVAARLCADPATEFSRVVFVSEALIRASEIAQRPMLAVLHPRMALFVGIQFGAGIFHIPGPVLSLLIATKCSRQALLWPFVARPATLDPSLLRQLLSRSGSSAVIQIAISAAKIDYIGALSEIQRSVELLFGDRDPLISEYDLVELSNLVPISRIRQLPECGHWPWVEDVEGVVKFLNSED